MKQLKKDSPLYLPLRLSGALSFADLALELGELQPDAHAKFTAFVNTDQMHSPGELAQIFKDADAHAKGVELNSGRLTPEQTKRAAEAKIRLAGIIPDA